MISVLNNLFCIFLWIFPRRAESVSYESPAECVCSAIYTYLDVVWLAKEPQPIRRVESLNNIICAHESCVARDYDDDCAFKILYQTYQFYNVYLHTVAIFKPLVGLPYKL